MDAAELELQQRLADVFFVESSEMLNEVSLVLLESEEAGNTQDVIQRIFRVIHSIKGGAQSLGFDELSEVAHRMEDFMVPLQSGNCTVDEQSISLMLEAMDAIELQLNAYKTGQPPIECAALIARLSELTVAAQPKEFIPSEPPSLSAPAVVISEGARLLYLSFTVDVAAMMPSITAVMLLEHLRQAGRILYSKPDVDNPGMATAGEYFKQIAIIQTDICDDEVKQAAYRIGDISDIKLAEIDNSILKNAAKPSKGEIAAFNVLVREMLEILCCNDINQIYFNNIAKQIVDWGADSRGAAEWFPGGLSAWERMTSLLSDIVADDYQSNDETESVAAKTLQILWESVYNALCNHTYFYSLPISDILEGNIDNVIKQLQVSGVDVKVINVDLSKLSTIEMIHLKVLADFRDKLAKNGWVLWLISEGKYTRRHLNVLEISEKLFGDLRLYPSSYNAVITSKKIQ